jgi:Protein of unknown function (DUF2442)
VEYPNERAVSVRVLRPYVIEVAFSDGVRRQVDVEPLMWGEVFAPLRDPALFAQVSIDRSIGAVAWPNGADLASEFLYYGDETPYGSVNLSRPESAAMPRSADR